jgi:nucleoside-diphosphate-sugar epimerase
MIAVIGGSGFIGTRLCRRFEKSKKKFQIIDKAISGSFPERTIIADVRNKKNIEKALENASVIINLAAEHRDDVRPVSLYDEVNVDGARIVCEAATKHNINKIIFTSSVAVYGFSDEEPDENGKLSPFNDYGRTKMLAEDIYKKWQAELPDKRSLVIIRPTVVFGERNRGNLYILFKFISSGYFVMIGNGKNKKSMAYVENVAAFIEYILKNKSGVFTYNYIDKPDYDMNTLVSEVRSLLGFRKSIAFRIPYILGYLVGSILDLISAIVKKNLPLSGIRLKKFCSTTQFESSISKTKFIAPVILRDGLESTIRFEFIEDHRNEPLFYTE